MNPYTLSKTPSGMVVANISFPCGHVEGYTYGTESAISHDPVAYDGLCMNCRNKAAAITNQKVRKDRIN